VSQCADVMVQLVEQSKGQRFNYWLGTIAQ